MRYLLGIILIYCFYNVSSQTTFAKIMDFNNTPQYADQLVEYKGDYYMAYTQVCIDEDGDLFESCGGVIKLDNHANVLDSNLIRRYSDNNECIVIDSIQNKMYLTGEEYFKRDYAHRFMVNEFALDSFKNIKQSFYKYPSNDQINYFQKSSVQWNNNLILAGSSRDIVDDDIKTLVFGIKKFEPDRIFTFDFGLSTLVWSVDVDINNNLVFYFSNQIRFENDRSIILKLDTSFQEVWRWESPKLGEQLPYGCQLSDGRLIVAMHTPGLSNIGSVWCINDDKSIAWKMEFPEINGGQQRRILGLKQLKNGDIVGVGYYGDTRNDNPDYIQIPFIFRLTNSGQLKWLKAFYRDITLPNGNIVYGYFSDVVEMENGDLMAVGRIDNFLEYDPIAMTERADPDILVVRTDANGCIDDQCATVTKIEHTVGTTAPAPSVDVAYTYLFPNPGTSSLELLNNDLVERLEIFSITGEVVKSIQQPSKTIDVDELKGMYVATFLLKNGSTYRQKLIIH